MAAAAVKLCPPTTPATVLTKTFPVRLDVSITTPTMTHRGKNTFIWNVKLPFIIRADHFYAASLTIWRISRVGQRPSNSFFEPPAGFPQQIPKTAAKHFTFCHVILKILLHSIIKAKRWSIRINYSLSQFLFLAQQPPVGQGLLIHEISRSHTTTHHSR